jgi:putative hydrolase of the HAD superfamily
MITTIVFDLDDTLYDEIDYCRSGFAAVAETLAKLPGLSVGADKVIFNLFWQEFTSGNRDKVFNTALEKLGLPVTLEIIERFVKLYRVHKPSLTLPPASKAVLDTLQKKYTLALLTDGYLPAQELKVAALGIKKYFKHIVYTEALGREFWKPSPVGYEGILMALNVNAENCVYVGDNEIKDFIAPNRLGFASTIRLIRPNSIHTQRGADPNAPAAHTITDIAELPKLLESLCRS